MNAGSQAENGEILTSVEGYYLPSTEMVRLLELSDAELSRLARNAILERQPDPRDSRAYLYPLSNVTRYILHCRRRKEGAHIKWLQEKSRAARVQRQKAELEMQITRGKLIDPEELFEQLKPRMDRIRKALELALRAGVPRQTIDQIAAIMKEGCDGLEDDLSSNTPKVSRNGDAPGR